MRTSRQRLLAAVAVLALGLAEWRVATTPVRPPDLGYSGQDMGPVGPEYRDVTMHRPPVDAVTPDRGEEDLPPEVRELLEIRREQGVDGKDHRRRRPQAPVPPEDLQGLVVSPVPAAPDGDRTDWRSPPSWGWLADRVLEARRGSTDAGDRLHDDTLLRKPADESRAALDTPGAALPVLPRDALTPGTLPETVQDEDAFLPLRGRTGGRGTRTDVDAFPGVLAPVNNSFGTDTRPALTDRPEDTGPRPLDTRRESFADTLHLRDDDTDTEGKTSTGRTRHRLRDEDGLGTLGR